MVTLGVQLGRQGRLLPGVLGRGIEANGNLVLDLLDQLRALEGHRLSSEQRDGKSDHGHDGKAWHAHFSP